MNLLPNQWSDDDTIAIASEDGININGAIVPWSTISTMATLATPERIPFVAWLQSQAATRNPDGSEATSGDMLALLAEAEKKMAELPTDEMPAEVTDLIETLIGGGRSALVDIALEEEGLPTENAVEPEQSFWKKYGGPK